MPQPTEEVPMPPPQLSTPAPACRRNPDSPADQALSTIVKILARDGYSFSIPSWDGHAYLRISNALQAVTDVTITPHGDIIWEYRSARYPHASERSLIATAIELLDPDRTMPLPALAPDHLKLTPLGAIRHALARYGLAATIAQVDADIGPLLTAANPRQPCRGTVLINSDSELAWTTRAPHHRAGGIPLSGIATSITRALARAEHPAIHQPNQVPA
jgi:hypothetical protein